MGYTIVPSVVAGIRQATELWPNRSRLSDGTVGDADHANRNSDHNPDDSSSGDNRDSDRLREVHAFDLTHDPVHGVDCNVIAEDLRRRCAAGIEKRVSYIIWRRQICSTANRWQWVAYTGVNPHDKHMHVSVRYTDAAELDTSPWYRPTETPIVDPAETVRIGGIDFPMAIFKSQEDAERTFIRSLYLTYLKRAPESFEAVEWWRLELHAKGADLVVAAFADSPEGAGFLKREREHLGV